MQQVLSVSDEPEKLLDGLLNPPVDVKEYPGCYVFLVDMPGLKDTDIKVEVEEEKVLCISGERKRNDQVQNIKGKYIHMERRFGKFTRKLILPDHCNLEEISGVCLNGVLTVTVPKVLPPEPRSPKTIKVKIG